MMPEPSSQQNTDPAKLAGVLACQAGAGLQKERRAAEAAQLFRNCALALASGALRLKPRERQLALLLAVESFGSGKRAVRLDVREFWERLGDEWRLNELTQMLESWRRAGWIAADVAVGEYRLAPDRLPGWADCFLSSSPGTATLPLSGGEHLGSLMAEASQEQAARATAKISQHCENFAVTDAAAKISQLGGKGGLLRTSKNPETFNRFNVKRLNVGAPSPPVNVGSQGSPGDCENFAVRLMERVRQFVGEADWANECFWNSGLGWRARLFVEEGTQLEAVLRYVQAGLKTGEIQVQKTRGALLWNEFQRARKEARQP